MMSDPLGFINQNHAAGGVIPKAPPGPSGLGEASGTSFKDVLMQNIEQVNKLQQDAEMAVEDLVTGRRDDMDQVMMAKQKADLAFTMLLQVRNKMMDAYQEIKQMRV